ncbi:MAG: CoA ester lyase [Gemmatimonadetes bacterium]|nr:CoA ester lyase [Gemmatimonadota bacterium]
MTSLGLAAWRSILFVPGDRPDRFAKALAAGADAVCIDLEDAVAPGRKAEARVSVVRLLAETSNPPRRDTGTPAAPRPHIIVRVNDPESDEGRRDAAALTGGPTPDAFMIPKVTTSEGLRNAWRLLGGDTPLVPIIETALGLENAARIGAVSPAAAASPAGAASPARAVSPPPAAPMVAALIFGGFDLSVELGAEPGWEALLYARSRVVHAAALSGLDAIDMPSRDLADMSGLRTEAVKARSLGYAGKVAIHPAQIPVIHEAFTPSTEEVRRAGKIVEADRAAGGGAVAVDGKMVDRPVVEAARRILARGGSR